MPYKNQLIIPPQNKPQTEIIIHQYFKEKPNKRKYLSPLLLRSILQTIKKQEKSILFLNKKGWARSLICEDCGYIYQCKNCDIPLAFHKEDDNKNYLVCHRCGYKEKAPTVCGNCQSYKINMLGAGDERIAEELQGLSRQYNFRFRRLDSESKIDDIIQTIQEFNNKKIDIIIGTEIILKPQLEPSSLVGIVNIDDLFTFPDVRQEEKIMRYLVKLKQLAKDKFIIQTVQKDNYLFQIIKNNDYDLF